MAIDSGDLVGGGAVLTMPQYLNQSNRLQNKSAGGTVNTSFDAGFYTAIEIDHTALGFDAATLLHAADTTEQTVVDLTSQSGVLTNVISPKIASASATMTIRVTIDGKVTTFTDVLTLTSDHILILGDSQHIDAQTSTVNSTYGSQGDVGWNANAFSLLMTPLQVLERGLHGMPFEDSCKVTIQGGANLTPSSASHKAVATFALTKPEGL